MDINNLNIFEDLKCAQKKSPTLVSGGRAVSVGKHYNLNIIFRYFTIAYQK